MNSFLRRFWIASNGHSHYFLLKHLIAYFSSINLFNYLSDFYLNYWYIEIVWTILYEHEFPKCLWAGKRPIMFNSITSVWKNIHRCFKNCNWHVSIKISLNCSFAKLFCCIFNENKASYLNMSGDFYSNSLF